jgi:hypothetical protein
LSLITTAIALSLITTAIALSLITTAIALSLITTEDIVNPPTQILLLIPLS